MTFFDFADYGLALGIAYMVHREFKEFRAAMTNTLEALTDSVEKLAKGQEISEARLEKLEDIVFQVEEPTIEGFKVN